MPPRHITENPLFNGDTLFILGEHIQGGSVDLIYLDPPFNSNRNYNVLFKDESGVDSEAQITAFEDTWHWNKIAEETYHEIITQAPDNVAQMIAALRGFVGTNQMMAHLVMMAARLVELHRVLMRPEERQLRFLLILMHMQEQTSQLALRWQQAIAHFLKVT